MSPSLPLLSKALLRHYSTSNQAITPTLLEKAAVTAYLCAAFALPAIPTYMATSRSKQDGTYMTRPRDTFPVLRPHF